MATRNTQEQAMGLRTGSCEHDAPIADLRQALTYAGNERSSLYDSFELNAIARRLDTVLHANHNGSKVYYDLRQADKLSKKNSGKLKQALGSAVDGASFETKQDQKFATKMRQKLLSFFIRKY